MRTSILGWSELNQYQGEERRQTKMYFDEEEVNIIFVLPFPISKIPQIVKLVIDLSRKEDK